MSIARRCTAVLVAVVLSVAGLAGCSRSQAAAPSSTAIAVGSAAYSLRSGGQLRDYRVYRPADLPAHPALVWMPGGARPAGSGKPDRAIAVPHPLVVTFPPVPTPSGMAPSGMTAAEH